MQLERIIVSELTDIERQILQASSYLWILDFIQSHVCIHVCICICVHVHVHIMNVEVRL